MKPLPSFLVERTFRELKKTPVKLLKSEEASSDVYGTAPQFTTYEIEALVLPSMSREMFYRMEGMLEDGTLRMFAYPEYVIGSSTIAVETGDKVTIEDMTGEILSVYDYVLPDGIVLKECIIK